MSLDSVDQQTAVNQQRGWRERIRESRMGTLLVLGVTAAIVMAGAYVVGRPSAAEAGVQKVTLTGTGTGAPPRVGTAAQDFKATTVDGKTVSLSSYKGQPVWLTFGASWCAPCAAEAPDVEAAYQKFKPGGAVVLAVSISEDSATVRDFRDRLGLTFPMLADPDTNVASAYRVNGIPAHYFIDRSGVLRSVKTGGLSPEQMNTALTEISR
jgi:cytochrome c biogenesis protein CcmG/thiol:disulfide interchange protein DsbE